MNDPIVLAKLLRAIAGGTDAQAIGHDTIFKAAAELLEQCAEAQRYIAARKQRQATWQFEGVIYRTVQKPSNETRRGQKVCLW
jgi:hypothetical protein